MAVVAVGINERDVSLDVFEQSAISERDLPKALRMLCDSDQVSEAVVLSTCLRTEVYAVVERFHDGLADIERFFRSLSGAMGNDVPALSELLSCWIDDAAVSHLFDVAAGIDSPVLGEGEILRQVRTAAELARQEKAAGRVLLPLFRHAVEAGKRVRTETAIARGTTSLAHAAVALAADNLEGGLAGRSVLVIGSRRDGSRFLQGARTARAPGPHSRREPLSRAGRRGRGTGGRRGGEPYEVGRGARAGGRGAHLDGGRRPCARRGSSHQDDAVAPRADPSGGRRCRPA